MCGFFGKAIANAERGQPVEDSEFALAQPLVDQRLGLAAGERAGPADDLGRLLGADLGRGQDDFGAVVARHGREPAACCFRLVDAER